MPYRACPYCKAGLGLRGIDGHGELVLASYPAKDTIGKGPVFRCSSCRSLWMRRYSGDGNFEWTREAAPESEQR